MFDKVDNQTFGDTLQKLSQLLMEKSQSGNNRILKDRPAERGGQGGAKSQGPGDF